MISKLESVKSALEFYVEQERHPREVCIKTVIDDDGGEKAKVALAELNEVIDRLNSGELKEEVIVYCSDGYWRGVKEGNQGTWCNGRHLSEIMADYTIEKEFTIPGLEMKDAKIIKPKKS